MSNVFRKKIDKFCTFLISLENARANAKYKVVGVELNDASKRRLEKIGLTTGAEILPLCRSPFGDPIVFYLYGSKTALRKTDCAKIWLAPKI